jgi:AraC-like DNA-binding protein
MRPPRPRGSGERGYPPRVRYVEVPPPPALRAFVRCAWALRSGPRPGSAPDRLLPDGRLEIVVHRREPYRRIAPDGRPVPAHGAVVAGQLSRAIGLVAEGPVHCVGLRLEPAGARALLRAPLADLEDRIVPLSDAIGAEGRRLAEAIGEARDAPAALDAMWSWTAARLRGATAASPCDRAVSAWRRDGGLAAVEDVARSLGLSRRQVERRFPAEVGLAPKRFARVVRLQRAARRLRDRPQETLAAVAARVGCFDQAHLTREFVELAGVPPSRWIAEEQAVAAAFLGGEGEP